MNNKENIYTLIIDKIGFLGFFLSQTCIEHGQKVVLCSSRFFPKKNIQTKKMRFLHFKKRLPSIPDLPYSKIFLVVNDEKEIFDALDSILKKAQRDGSIVILLQYYKNFSAHLKGLLTRQNLKASLILIGDIIFSNKTVISQDVFSEAHAISRLLEDLKTDKKIVLNGMGTRMFRPIYYETVLDELRKIVYSQEIPRILFLFSQTQITELTLARYIKQIFPQIKIDFTKAGFPKQPFFRLPDEGVYIPRDYDFKSLLKENIKKDLQDIDRDDNKTNKQENKKETLKNNRGGFFNSLKSILFHALFIIFGVLILPLIATLILSFFGIQNLQTSRQAWEQGDLSKSKTAIHSAQYFFKTASEVSTLFAIEASLLNLGDESRPLLRTIDSGKGLTFVMEQLIKASEIASLLFGNKSKNPKDDLLKALQQVRSASKELQKIDISFEDTYIDKNSINAIRSIGGKLGVISELSESLPEILGFNGEKVYLVLLQNNMELRPGGGFIGSLGLLKIQNARIKNFEIRNVYEADGQLKGHVEPPFAIRRYIPSEHWYLRDSNFNVDFQKNAEDALFFLDKEIQVDADGVVAINVSFIPKLLSVIGPVTIPDYNKTLTKENAYQVIQLEVEKNSFAGSTQKSDFLSSVFQAIVLKITSEKSRNASFFPGLLFDAVQKKEILLYAEDPSIKRYLIANNFSSSLWDDREEDGSRINDFVGISEANLGVNKVNYFIKRKIQHEVEIKNTGVVNEKILVKIDNESKKDEYKNYMRYITPQNTSLKQIAINDGIMPISPAITDPLKYEKTRFNPPDGIEVEQYSQENKTIFGFLTLVLPKTSKKIAVQYSLPKIVDFTGQSITYDLIVFKQSGVESFPYSLKLFYPQEYKVLKVEPKGFFASENAKNNSITLLRDITEDSHIIISLTHE